MSETVEKMDSLNVNGEANHDATVASKPDYREEARKEVASKLEEAGWHEKFGKGLKAEKGWAASAERYEWLEEYGDVAPEFPELERQLFHNEHITRPGARFDG